MRDALLDQNRTILYSLCDWGQADVNTWGNGTGNSWRMSGDISGMSMSMSMSMSISP
jgi:alpha-galactosidase